MDRLEQVKNAVTANGMREWTDERVGQAMREYAAEMVRHNLEKQHECIRNLIRIYHNTDGDELKASITDIVDTWMKARDLITSLEIELI